MAGGNVDRIETNIQHWCACERFAAGLFGDRTTQRSGKHRHYRHAAKCGTSRVEIGGPECEGCGAIFRAKATAVAAREGNGLLWQYDLWILGAACFCKR